MSEQLHYRDGRPYARRVFIRDGKPRGVDQGRCGRCGGAGGSEKWRHTGWTCYECGGHGRGRIYQIPLYTLAQLEKLNASQAKAEATRAAKRAAAAAKAEAERIAAEAARRDELNANPLFARALAYADRSEFIGDIVDKWRSRDLSEKQEAALVGAIDRIEKRDRDLAASQEAGWVGQIDERVDVEGVVAMVRCIYAGAGTIYDPDRFLIKIRRPDGAVFSWFTGSHNYAEGDAVKGKAKVKKHDEYRGEKSTVISNFRAAKGLTPAAT